MYINVHRTPFHFAAIRPGNLLNEESTPPRHHAAKGNTTFFLLNPISGYRIRLSTLSRDEIRDRCASRGEGNRRNKSTRETIPFRPVFRSQKSPDWGWTSGRCAPVSPVSRVLGPLMWYFISHNPPFMERPFVLEEWKCVISMAISLLCHNRASLAFW